jgi:hypothetical protein
MAININDDSMSLEVNGATVNAAIRLGSLWRVTGWPRLLTRDEAITALALAERLLSGRSADAIAALICAANPRWLRRLIYPAFASAAAPGRCSADTTRRIMTCLMPSMRKPARSIGLNAASTSGLASWRFMNWGCVTS